MTQTAISNQRSAVSGDIPTLVWHGCYDDSWRGIIVPEAFSHPAKFARGLVTRIVRHGLDRGYWKRGETVGDPFGGVALGRGSFRPKTGGAA